MKKNYDYAFSFGFVCGLEKKLIKKTQTKSIEKCTTIKELQEILQNMKYEVSSFINYEDFCNKLNGYYNKLVEEIKNICPEKDKFYYLFCKNDFLNFKIILKSYLANNIYITQNTINPNTIDPKIIKRSIETKNFEEIISPFKEIFTKNFARISRTENIKLAEIFLDKDMYELMGELSKDDCFLKEITKLEITIKNINFCIRYINYDYDINQLKNFIMNGSYIEKEEYITAAKKGEKSLYSLTKKIDIKSSEYDMEEILTKKLEEIYNEQILNCFCFAPIFIYIKKLEKEIKFLKEVATNIIFENRF